MNATAATLERIRFRGSPPRVDALVPLGYEEMVDAQLSARIDLPVQKGRVDFIVQPAPAGSDVTRLRLLLPESTPAGTYHGTMRLASGERAIEVIVDVRPALTFSPSHLSLVGTPGGREEVELTVVNRGNVPLELPAAVRLEIVDGEGVPETLSALRGDERRKEDKAKSRDRVERVVDEMARHVESLQLDVREGTGMLNPGELRQLRLNVRYPKSLKPGRSYVGAWTFANQIYVVAVHVPAAPAEEQIT